jgi:hypothetical protein
MFRQDSVTRWEIVGNNEQCRALKYLVKGRFGDIALVRKPCGKVRIQQLPPTNSKRTWLGDIAMALLNSPLGKAVWTTQANAVAALTEGAVTAALSVAADARRFPALSIASAWKTLLMPPSRRRTCLRIIPDVTAGKPRDGLGMRVDSHHRHDLSTGLFGENQGR